MAENGKISTANAVVSLAGYPILRMRWETGREKGKLHTIIENVKIISHKNKMKKEIQTRTEIIYHLVRTDRRLQYRKEIAEA